MKIPFTRPSPAGVVPEGEDSEEKLPVAEAANQFLPAAS